MSTSPQPARPLDRIGLLIEQYNHWRRGEHRLVEEYVSVLPSLQEDPEQLLDLIYQEFVLREERGEAPRCDEYQERFPALATMIRDQFGIHQLWVT